MADVKTRYVLVGKDETKRAFSSFQRSAQVARRAAFALSTAVVGATGALAALGVRAINSADQIAKLQDRLGISVEALSELKFAAETGGVAFNQLALGLQRLQRRVAEAAQGLGEAQGALKELNIDARQLATLPLEQQLRVVADRLRLVETDADRTRLAFKLFDSEGVALLQVLKDGSEGLDEYARRARQLGAVLDNETAQKAAEAKDRLTELSATFDGLANNVIPPAAEALTTFTQALNDLFFGADRYDQLLREYTRALNNLERIRNSRRGGQGRLAAAAAEVERLERALEELRQTSSNIGGGDTGKSTIEQAVLVPLERINQEAGTTERLFDTLGNSLIPNTLLTQGRAAQTLLALQQDVNAELEETNDLARDLGFTFSSAFEDAIVEGEGLRSVLQGLLQDIIRIAARVAITEPIGNAIGSALSNTFGGFRESGGPVSRGRGYIVGENGPEYFMPRNSGTIIPNGAMGGVSLNYSIDARGADEARILRVLPPILEQSQKATIAEIKNLQLQGRF